MLVLALIASAARSAEWPVLVALGRWLAAAMALVVAAVALAAKRGWRSPGWLPVIGVALGVLAAMALTGRQSLAGRSFADIHSASFGLPTELAWVLIGLGVQRIRSRDDLIGRGALALGLGWALTALVAPDVLFGRLVWTWSQASALTLVAWLVLVAVALGALLIVLAPARAAKNVWGFVGLAGPIAGGLLVVSSLATANRRYPGFGSSVLTVAKVSLPLLVNCPANVARRSTVFEPLHDEQLPDPLPSPPTVPSTPTRPFPKPGVAIGSRMARATQPTAMRRPTAANGEGSHMSTPLPSPVKRRPNRRTRSTLSVTSSHRNPAAPIANGMNDTLLRSIATGTA